MESLPQFKFNCRSLLEERVKEIEQRALKEVEALRNEVSLKLYKRLKDDGALNQLEDMKEELGLTGDYTVFIATPWTL